MAITISACQSQPQNPLVGTLAPLSPVTQVFANELRPAVANVATSIRLTQPIFSVGGIALKVNGQDLHMFEYLMKLHRV